MNSNESSAAGNGFRRPVERVRIKTNKPFSRSISKERLIEMKQKKERELHRISQEIIRLEKEEHDERREKEKKEREELEKKIKEEKIKAKIEKEKLQREKDELEKRVQEEEIKRKETILIIVVLILNIWTPGLGIIILSLISEDKMKSYILIGLSQFSFYYIFDGYFNFWLSIIVFRTIPILACLNDLKTISSDGKIKLIMSNAFLKFINKIKV